jgi:hypothetical protein
MELSNLVDEVRVGFSGWLVIEKDAAHPEALLNI